MKSKQVDTNDTKPVRLDVGWHKILKVDAARAEITIKELLEACLTEAYEKIRKEYGLVDG